MPAMVAVEHRRFVIMLSGIFFDLVERADFGLLEQQPLPFGLHHRAVGQSRVAPRRFNDFGFDFSEW